MAEHTITEFVDELDSLDSDGIFAWLAESRSIQARLEAAVLRAYQRLDRGGAALLDGARSTASWVEHRTGVPAQTVRERLKVGRFLDTVPVIEKHFNAGDIHYSHVRALATIHNPRTAAAMAADEQFFVDQAKQLTVRDYITLSRFWLARVDVDGAERSANELWQSRRAWIAETLDGTIEVSATFDPENGAVFRNAVDAVFVQFASPAKADFVSSQRLKFQRDVFENVSQVSAAFQSFKEPAPFADAASMFDHRWQPRHQSIIESRNHLRRSVFE